MYSRGMAFVRSYLSDTLYFTSCHSRVCLIRWKVIRTVLLCFVYHSGMIMSSLQVSSYRLEFLYVFCVFHN